MPENLLLFHYKSTLVKDGIPPHHGGQEKEFRQRQDLNLRGKIPIDNRPVSSLRVKILVNRLNRSATLS